MDGCESGREPAPLSGRVHSVDSFASADGPGVRFIIFLQGCALRCRYCHNADTWRMEGGTLRFSDDLLSQALRYRAYWGEGGGITVSGGEPLLQMAFVTDLFRRAKAAGVHTALDTAGQPFTREEPFLGGFRALMEVTDLVLLDIKHIDSDAHRVLTGRGNENILDLARYLDEIGKPVWIRHVLVPQYTDDDAALAHLGEFLSTLHNVERIEVLPYHTLGAFKWKALGLDYPLAGISPPTSERITNAEHLLGIR